MAYTTATLNRIAGGVGTCPQVWVYTTADAHGTVSGASYFSDGSAKGMKAEDFVFVNSTTPTSTMHRVASVTAGGAATVGAATLA